MAANEGTSISALLAAQLDKMARDAEHTRVHAGVLWPDRGKALSCGGPLPTRGTNCMSDKCFVDTNILAYAHDRSAGLKHKRAQLLIVDLWNSGRGVLSTQVLQELCINVRRKTSRPLSVEETRRLVQDYLSWEIVVNTPASIIQALDIEVRHKISFWDALILQAAESSGVAILYSEDLATGQRYGSIRVVNPLTESSSPSPADPAS